MVHRYFRQLPLLLSLVSLLIFGGFVPNVRAQETTAPATEQVAEKKEDAIPLKAAPLFTIGKFTVTNSMLVTWIVALGIILLRAACDPKHQAGADRSAELLGVAGRRAL